MSKEDNQKVYFGDKKVEKLEKKEGVESIFSKVSDNYDLMNDLMSVGTHRIWKRHFVDTAGIQKDDTILDLAAGTGDIAKKLTKFVSNKTIHLCDQNKEMIDKAIERSLDEGFYNKCNFNVASAENLPYEDNYFNHVFISFGFRNFSDKNQCLKEIQRVLKPGGKLHILEFSRTNGEMFTKIYDFFSFNIIPKIGDLVSNDAASYEYLVKSIRTHESQEQLCNMLESNGFQNTKYTNLFKGIVAIHQGEK